MRGTKQPVSYDFRRPSKFNRDHVRALQIANETFARQFTTVLSTSLRQVSEVSLGSVSQLTYDEYIRDVPNPTYLGVLSMAPLPGTALLHMPLPLMMIVIDRLLGGSGSAASGHLRPLTEIEQVLCRDLLRRVLRELSYAYESLVPVQPELVDQESNPQFAQVAAASDLVVVATFAMKIGTHEDIASLCIPLASLQPVLDQVAGAASRAARKAADAASLRVALEHRVGLAPVDVSVRLDPAVLASGDLVDLAPGDIVPFGHPVDQPLTVAVDGIPCFAARLGRRGKRLACEVVAATPQEVEA